MISTHNPDDETVVIRVEAARIDAVAAMAFKEQVREVVRPTRGRVVLDLARVEFVDSSGLGSLVAIMKMLGGGRRLELANCGNAVRKVLTLTHMDSVFDVHPEVPDAGDADAGQDAA